MITTQPDHDTFQIVEYDPRRIDEIITLMNLSLGRANEVRRDAAYWRWKHEENPFGKSIVLLGDIDGELVGMRSFLKWQFRVNDELVSAAKPVDTVTHPKFQRRGIFRQLTGHAIDLATRDDIQFLFNTPNENSAPGYLKLGWQPIGRLAMQLKPLRPIRIAVNVVYRKFGLLEAHSAEFVTQPHESVIDLCNDQHAVDDLLTNTATTPHATTYKSIEYLRWRYASHPHHHYDVVAVAAERLDAIAIYRVKNRSGNREAMLAECIVRKGVDEAGRQAIREVVRRSQADYLIAHATPTSAAGELLRANRFYRVPRVGMSLYGRTLGQLPAGWDLFDIGQWNMCLGDLEGL